MDDEAFRWTASGGMQFLGDLPGGSFRSSAQGASADGSIVVGHSNYRYDDWPDEAFRWTASGGIQGLGFLPGGDYSFAFDVSADGTVVVGWGNNISGYQRAFRWTETLGMQDMGALAFNSYAYGISSDGSVVVGESNGEAFRWTQAGGMQGLGDLPGGFFVSQALDVSANGMVVIGFSYSASGIEAFRWTQPEGMVGLGSLPGLDVSYARATSGDGSIVVGNCTTDMGGDPSAFIWDLENGMQNLKDVLVDNYGLDLTGWTLYNATGISDDGSTIVGRGSGGSWVATIPALVPPTLVASVVSNGQTQRSTVRAISAQFSEDVTITSDTLSIIGQSHGSIDLTGVVFDYNSVSFTATWTMSQSLPDDKYTATLDASKITDSNSRNLDGNGDGIGGDDATFEFHRLFGDATGNAVVDTSDLALLASRWLDTPADTGLDTDNNNFISFLDFAAFAQNWLKDYQ